MAPASVKAARLKKGGKWDLPAPVTQEKVWYISVPPARTLKLVSVCRFFSNCYSVLGFKNSATWVSTTLWLRVVDLSPTSVQSQMLWEFLFLVQVP